jgi:hypothetical protein
MERRHGGDGAVRRTRVLQDDGGFLVHPFRRQIARPPGVGLTERASPLRLRILSQRLLERFDRLLKPPEAQRLGAPRCQRGGGKIQSEAKLLLLQPNVSLVRRRAEQKSAAAHYVSIRQKLAHTFHHRFGKPALQQLHRNSCRLRDPCRSTANVPRATKRISLSSGISVKLISPTPESVNRDPLLWKTKERRQRAARWP